MPKGMRYPKGRRYPKNDGSKSGLTVIWNKPAHEEVDLQYYWRMSNEDYNSANRPIMKPDINLLMHHFQSLKGYSGRTLVEELTERGYDISTLKFTIEKLKPMTLNASDFVFGIGADETDPDMIGVAITPKEHFDAEGFMLSEHMADQIEGFWPEGIEMDEVQEGFFLIGESELTKDKLVDEFVKAGFIHSPALEVLFS